MYLSTFQGSGKTLAFGIPILEFVMKSRGTDKKDFTKGASKKKKRLEDKGEVGGVVDLNMVYHYEVETDGSDVRMDNVSTEPQEMTEVEEEISKEDADKNSDEIMADEDCKERSEGEDEILEEDNLEEDANEEDDSISISDSQEEEEPQEDTGLVEVRDNIPDQEFLAAMKTGVHKGLGKTHIPMSKTALPEDPGISVQPEGPVAIILVPTRELAMQIHSHITAVSKYTKVQVRCIASYCVPEIGAGDTRIYCVTIYNCNVPVY